MGVNLDVDVSLWRSTRGEVSIWCTFVGFTWLIVKDEDVPCYILLY